MIIPQANRLNSVSEYYFSKKLKEIANLNQTGVQVINLGIGSPDLAPHESVIETLHKTSSEEKNHGYQKYNGIDELRNQICVWQKETYGFQLNKNEILPLLGSKEGIMHISMAFLNPGDAVLIPNPGYPAYASVSNLVQANIEHYNLSESSNWQIDFDYLETLDLNKVKLMWVNFPNMPTGVEAEKTTFIKLIALAKKHQFLIVNDNPYSLILNEEPKSILSIDGAKEVCLELNSLSKSHNMAGWRVGWISGKEEYLQSIIKVKSNVDSGMFLPTQLAAISALKLNKNWSIELNKVYEKRRELIWELFDLLECKYSKKQVGMFVWAKLPENVVTDEIVDEILYKKRVFITPGFIFGSNGKPYLRASLCSNEETILEAIKRIKK